MSAEISLLSFSHVLRFSRDNPFSDALLPWPASGISFEHRRGLGVSEEDTDLYCRKMTHFLIARFTLNMHFPIACGFVPSLTWDAVATK